MSLRLLVIGLVVVAVAGCNAMRRARLLEPTAYGMEQIAPRVYVKRDMAEEPRLQLLYSYEMARQRVSEFYGGLATDPTVYGCESLECIQSFGGWGDGIAIVLPERQAILLWPLVFGPGDVAHEWSHVEVNVRLAGGAGRTVS